jgi:hypothetical protein
VTWAAELQDNRAIAEYVARFSPYDVCEEQIEDLYIGCKAVLEWRALDTLTHGNADGNQEDSERQKACDALRLKTMPPLLVDDGEVLDGNHRLRALLKRGVTHFWVYNIIEWS